MPTSPNIWIKAFWGFDPENGSYVGFTNRADRNRFISRANQGDLMLVYGAKNKETRRLHRGKTLGLLQIDTIPVRDVERSSKKWQKEKASRGLASRWKYAIPVRRAWRIDSLHQEEIVDVAPSTYRPARGRIIARRAEQLTPEEAERVFDIPRREVNVYGESPLGSMADDSLRPSHGPPEVFGQFFVEHMDGERFLYVLQFIGNVAALLERPASAIGSKILVKVGCSYDPQVRLSAHNAHLPWKPRERWRLLRESRAFPRSKPARAAEKRLKALLEKRTESLGGEFFLGARSEILATFAKSAL